MTDNDMAAPALLAPELIGWAIQEFGVKAYDRCTTLIQQGQPIDSLFLLIDGEGKVISQQTAAEEPVAVTTLQPPQMVGEMSWLEGKPAMSTVEAGVASQWIRIPFQTLRNCLESAPDLAELLYRTMARKLAQQMSQQNRFIHRWPRTEVEPLRKIFLLFDPINDADVSWLAEQGELRHYQPDVVVIREGAVVPNLGFVLNGTARVQVGTHVVGSSRSGEILGEMGLLHGDDQAGASVEADSPLALMEVDKRTIRERIKTDQAFSARFHHGLALILSHRCRDSYQAYGLHQPENDTGELDLSELEQISDASRRFDWLCRQWLS